MTPRLVLLRHGRTAWNATGRFQGQADPPLDDVGVAQARAAGARLAPLRPWSILSSDLARAQVTAEIIAAACHAAGDAGPNLLVDPALREVALGDWEGLDDDEARRRFPDEHARWRAEPWPTRRRGGGETEAEAGARVAAAVLTGLSGVPHGATLIVVSHGLALRAAMAALGGTGIAPHLGNGQWLTIPAPSSPARRATLVSR
ncbi:MAG TPA: histidine phosphatase family protein [Acidimicrobiales bacterium]|nr:histidine phosphatase family protein [Acidimicrobiales bacterium]